MPNFKLNELLELDKIYRANLINSCTGFKSANLISTKSKDGIENVAVFSSVTHLSSNPPLLGFILRPTTVERNTYDNLEKTGYFTVNHIHQSIVKDAHHTSAKYDGDISEYSKTNLVSEYKDNFWATFVKDCPIQIACKFINEYDIKENGCKHIIGAIEHIYIGDQILSKDGWLNLEAAQTVTVNGLDAYASPKIIDRLSFSRPNETVTSIL